MKLEAIFYDKEDGTEPAREFILSLGEKIQAETQKTPVAEIERAKRYRSEYFSREGKTNGDKV